MAKELTADEREILTDRAMGLEATLQGAPRPASLQGKSDDWIRAELARIKNTLREAKNPRKR